MTLKDRRENPEGPTLSLCMIVKNEERFLEGCLESVEGVVNETIIVDTGSSDGTLAIAERYGAKILNFEWTGDFSIARNVSLEAASGDWILVLDADERLEASSRDALRRLLNAKDVAGYSLVCKNLVGTEQGGESQRAPVFRLLRNRPDIRFEGMIHEQAIASAKRTGLKACASEVAIVHLGYVAEEVVRRSKRQRNLEILERQIAAEPENPFVHFNMGEVLKLLGRREEAAAHYREALHLLETSQASHGVSYYANLYFSLSDLYREMGRLSEAHALLDEAIALYPSFADLYYIKGFTYFDEHRYLEAIALFKQCPRYAGVTHPFASDPAIPGHKALRAIADCHIKLGDRKQATSYLVQALSIDPNPDAALVANVGILLLEAGQEIEALRHFERALAQDPQEARSWLNWILIMLQLEDYQAIVNAWNRRPDDVNCQALMLLAFAVTDRCWPEVRLGDETLVQAWSEAAELAIMNERTGMVQALIDRLDGLGAALPSLELSLGRVFLRQKLPELALGAFMRAQQRSPGDPHIYCAWGDASLAAGRLEDACNMYAQAIELSPELAYPRQQLKQLASHRNTKADRD